MALKQNKGGRPRKGSLCWAKSGWRARVTVEEAGEKIQKVVNLKTTERKIAAARLKRLLSEGFKSSDFASQSSEIERFEDAARRVVQEQRFAGMITWSDRLRRLELYAFKNLGLCTATRSGGLV